MSESARSDHENVIELVYDATHTLSDQTILPENTVTSSEQLHPQLGAAGEGVEHGVDLARQLLCGQHGDTSHPGNKTGAEGLDDGKNKGQSFTRTCGG